MENDDTRILMIDTDFAVVNKRIGEICENTEEESSSLIAGIRPALEQRLGCHLPYIQAVHRIDRPVTGCVILSFTQKSASDFTDQFNQGRIKKRYSAIVEIAEKASLPPSGRLEHFLLFDRKRQKAIVRNTGKHKGYKSAVLTWETAGYTDRYACLYVYPETGRTHQIRAQLAAAGMPIKGDLKYGAKRSERGGGIRLHAGRIQFLHPVTGDLCTVTAPVENPDALWNAFPADES